MKVNLFHILCSVFIIALSSRAPAQPVYEGLLREDDLRIAQFRNLVKENKPLPEFLVLRYRGKEWNHVVFYDLDGKEALFRYRTDRFDDLAEKKVQDLLPGQVYRLPVKFTGLIERRIVYSAGSPEFSQLLESGEGRPGFDFIAADSVQPEFILY